MSKSPLMKQIRSLASGKGYAKYSGGVYVGSRFGPDTSWEPSKKAKGKIKPTKKATK